MWAGENCMLEIYLKQPTVFGKLGFMHSVYGHLLKAKKEYKILEKHEIWDIFIKTNQTRSAFNKIWFVMILKIY